MKKGRFNCWAAKGPAQEAFEKVRVQIIEILEIECDRVPNSGYVMFRMFMIGRTQASAVPNIMFSCADRESRKAAVAAVRNSKLLDQLPPGICLGDWPHPPDLIEIPRPLASAMRYACPDTVHDDKFTSMQKTYNIVKGQALRLELQKSSTELESGRSATIGSIVQISDRRFYLAPAHFYYPEEFFSPEVDFDLEDSECDFGVLDDEPEDLSDAQEAELMSQYSLSPESSDLEEDWDLDDNNSLSDCESDYLISGEQSERLNSDIVAPEEDVTYSIPDNAHITSLHHFTSPEAVLPTVNSDSLDYCLIEIGKSEHCLPDLPVLSRENIGQPRSGSTNVLAATGAGNVLVGVLSSGLSCVRLPKATTYMSVLTVKFERSLQRGDSGSIVRDAKTGMIYGHIVAGDTGSQTALVIPATQVFNDIILRLSIPRQPTGDGLRDMYLQAPPQCVSCLMKPAPHHIASQTCCYLPRAGGYNGPFQEVRILDRSGITFRPTKGPETANQTSLGGRNVICDVGCRFDSKKNTSLTVKSSLHEQNSDSPNDEWNMNQGLENLEIQSTQDTSSSMASIETEGIDATPTSCSTTLVRDFSIGKSRKVYTIGWICAFDSEYPAAMSMLDEKQDDPCFETSSNIVGFCSRAQSTNSWVLDDSRFQKWTEDKKDFLWVSGMPGLGKSVLSRTLPEGRSFDDESVTICHSLRGSERQGSIATAICALVQALSCGNEDHLRNHAERVAQLCVRQLGVDFDSLLQLGTSAACGSSWKLLNIVGAFDEVLSLKSDRLMQEIERLFKLEAEMDVKLVEYSSLRKLRQFSEDAPSVVAARFGE